MVTDTAFILDANVFIEAHKRYYSFDLCPGFWQSLVDHQKKGNLLSIDKVHEELVATKDELSEWVGDVVPPSCFVSTSHPHVVDAYGKLINWVEERDQYTSAALQEYGQVADGWLLAYAVATDGIIVTHEAQRPHARNRVPIPNVCVEFGIEYVDTFDMLRDLNVSFVCAQE